MRKKKGFALHRVCGRNIIIAEGKVNVDFENLVAMNETGAFLWDEMGPGEFTVEDMAGALMAEFGIDQELAIKDCESLVQGWLDEGIIEE